jgi:hypothetical protein
VQTFALELVIVGIRPPRAYRSKSPEPRSALQRRLDLGDAYSMSVGRVGSQGPLKETMSDDLTIVCGACSLNGAQRDKEH